MKRPAFATHQTGLTLVELLVAMTLVATLTAGGLATYIRVTAAWRSQAADQRRHERGQYVFGTLEPELQMAGYFGATRPAPVLSAATVPPSVRSCGTDLITRLDRPVEKLSSLPASCVARSVLLAGSDVLVVRRLSARVGAPRPGRAQWLIPVGAARNGALRWDGQIPADYTGAEVRDLIVRIYYVARSADGDARTPALRVKSLTEVAGVPAFVDTEVMPGVEALAVELLPQASPRSVHIALRVRADAADTDAAETGRALPLARQFTLRNALPWPT